MSLTDNKNAGCVLLSTEVEMYVQALQPFPIDEIGSKKYVFILASFCCFNGIRLVLKKDGQVSMK